MPYITNEQRDVLDDTIKRLSLSLLSTKNTDEKKLDGELNYVICSLISNLYDRNYFSLNRVMGVLTCVQLEVYRRIIAPYEDKKSIDNGDVF